MDAVFGEITKGLRLVDAWVMPGQLSSKGTHYQLEGDRNGDCYCMIHGLGTHSLL